MQVHDRAAQVRVECIRHAQVAEPADASDEGLLEEILGLGAVAAGQEVREAEPGAGVPLVQFGEAAGGRLGLRRGIGSGRPFVPPSSPASHPQDAPVPAEVSARRDEM